MDAHPTVTMLRDRLETPEEFTQWLEGQESILFGHSTELYKPGDLTPWGTPIGGWQDCTPLAAYLHYLDVSDKTLSDDTHCYWWVDGRAYSLMLPEWARALQREIGMFPVPGAAVLEKLEGVAVS